MNPRTLVRRFRVHGGAFALLVCALADPGHAQARSQRLSFRSTVEVPDEGVRFRVPQGAQPTGLGSPSIYQYRTPQGQIVEMQEPRDFWYPTQFRGRWEDRSGTRLTLAVPTQWLPADWPREHVTLEEYRNAVPPPRTSFSDAELAAWAESIADASLHGNPEDMQTPPRLSRARLFRFEGRAPRRIGVAFSFQSNPFQIDPDQWFFVLLELGSGIDLSAVERDLTRNFLSGISPFAPRETRSEAHARFRIDTPDSPVEPDREARFEASRRRAIDSIRGLRDWWYVETPNYVLVSDLPGGHASIVRRIQADVETLRSAFEILVPPLAPIEAVSVMRIFSDGSDYVGYVGLEWAHSGGAWIPGRGEMVIRPRDWGTVQEQRAWLFEVVYHEAFHQYLHYAVQGRPVSVWFNEGHATFVEGADVRGGQIRFNEVSRYAEVFTRRVDSGRLDLEPLLHQSYTDFYAGGPDAYARAWGLVYFLRKHAAQDPDNPFAELPARYLEALSRGADPEQATRQALNGESIPSLEAAISAFWKSVPARRAAQRFGG